VGDGAVAALRIAHVAHPLAEEPADVVVEGRRARERLGVTGPAEPLVALRAVGGDREEVAALTPDDVRLQLRQVLIRAGEITDRLHRRVQYLGGDVVGRERGQPGDLGVLEAAPGERGSELHRQIRFLDEEFVRAPGAAQRLDVQLATVVQPFGVGDDDLAGRRL